MADNCSHDCNNCSANCPSKNGDSNGIVKLTIKDAFSGIKKVIGVSSGKGGVGKSFVTSLLATSLQKKGYSCGILDADILGPSIPKSFGYKTELIEATEDNLMYPKVSKDGVKIISSNFLVGNETDPIIFRGSLIAGVLQQFYSDTIWGDLDFLFVDMPPGTGDVPLTVYQSIPIDEVVIVASPQALVSMIVEKSINMAEKMNIKIAGLIENMSYVECPNCKEKIEIFGQSNIEKVLKEKKIELLAKIPIRVNYSKLIDEGKIEDIEVEELNNAVKHFESLL